jgi:hypothetical protein
MFALTCSAGGLPASDDPMALVETKKEDVTETENGVVKANKGMILRKSVEYIRYDDGPAVHVLAFYNAFRMIGTCSSLLVRRRRGTVSWSSNCRCTARLVSL